MRTREATRRSRDEHKDNRQCGNTLQEMFRVCSLTEYDWIVMRIERDFPWWSKTNSAAYQVIAQSDCPVVVMREIRAQLPVACLHHLGEAALRPS